MKKFIFKSILFCLPFILIVAIELFVLPIDSFTFRVWEALAVRTLNHFLRGPFYPNMEIVKIEEGDLAHHTRFTFEREVKWITDRNGYRKRDTDCSRYEIVIVGESNIVGSGVTQGNMLSEVLEEKLNVSVYPFAPARMKSFLRERRFTEDPPKVVIFGMVERGILDLTPIKRPRGEKWLLQLNQLIQWLSGFKDTILKNAGFRFLAIQLDRASKMIMLHYFQASLRRSISGSAIDPEYIPSEFGPLFFLQGADANKDVPREKLEKALHTIQTYDAVLRSKGIRFIFLPIPEKENIFHEYLKTKRPVFLERLISGLKQRGIETVDTQNAFEEASRKGILLYHTNDTHWNENAVKITVDLIKGMIEKKE